MRRTKEEATQTRQMILDAALTIFSKQGYQAARLQEIAEAAGVTRGAIYHHFESKAGLYITLIEQASEQFDAVIAQAITEGGTFQQVGTRVLVNAWTCLEEDPHLAKVVELFNFKTGFTSELAEINQRREDESETLVNYVAGFMRQAIEDGELGADLDPVITARAFIAYQNGVMNLWLTNQEAFSLKKSAPALAAIFMQGIAAV
ncbi:MAG: TetR family transcriptional regulator [Chloroflexi bacterium]|nr:TetR family transcriptional regulator [Chloroflexota bacterium]